MESIRFRTVPTYLHHTVKGGEASNEISKKSDPSGDKEEPDLEKTDLVTEHDTNGEISKKRKRADKKSDADELPTPRDNEEPLRILEPDNNMLKVQDFKFLALFLISFSRLFL